MRASVLMLFLSLLALASPATPLQAGEPDGFVRITPVWTSEKETLTLRIDPVTPLAEARLIVLFPDVVTIGTRTSAASFRSAASQAGTRRLVSDMNSMLSGVTLELDVDAPAKGAGVVTFLVEGRTLDGRTFSEGIGVGLDRASRDELVRDGAIEYPAASGGGGR